MDDKTTALIVKLAEKLGTTAEHLWGVLINQAAISASSDLFVCAVLVVVSYLLVKITVKKTKKPTKTDEDRYPRAEWDGGVADTAVGVTIVVIGFTMMFILMNVGGILSAFLNPEFWALKFILEHI